MWGKTVFETYAAVSKNFIVRISAIQFPCVTHRSDPGERIVLVKYSAYSAKRVGRKMKTGELDIQRITDNHISGDRRSKKISWNLVKKVALDSEANVLQREVLTVDAASPGVISNCTIIIVIRP